MIGQTISHYKILEKLGEGGMGVVYKAQDLKLDRPVALKLLPSNLLSSEEEVVRFQQEARAISTLNHPNVATIYDVDEAIGPTTAGRQKFLVLEYLPGGTLKSRIKKLQSEGKELPLAQIVDYGLQFAEGLSHAHRHSIVHRDVKTDNVMLTEEGKVKITDFGLAKLRGSAQLTKTGSTVGTAAYMSPEQIRGEDQDHRSDLFSFGIVLYEMATGHLPFRGEHEAALSYSIVNENPLPIKSLRPTLPTSLENVIYRCLEKDRDKRFQNAGDIAIELRKIQQEISGYVSAPSRRSKLPWIVAAVFVVLALAALYVFMPSKPPGVDWKSIAVLPFKNLSEDKANEYFSDGITEDITTQISKISDLRVISRTSAMRYKNTDKSLREIAKELNVATILEGSVRRAGNQVRIVAQLIDASNDEHLWAETYDKELTQIFAIQSDVAQQIATALKARLSPAEKERIEKKPTEKLTAYDYYLKGRDYYYRYRQQDNENSIELFKRALELDPSYALAYAGLGRSYTARARRYDFPQAWADSGIVVCKKAISIDPNLPEAYTSLSMSYNQRGWHQKALEASRKAVELNPNYAHGLQLNGYWNMYVGNLDEALRWLNKTLAVDPSDPFNYYGIGAVYLRLDDLPRAEQWFRKGIELQPDFVYTYVALSLLYLEQGKHNEAIKECEKILSISPEDVVGLNALGDAELFSGNYVRAKEYYERAIAKISNRWNVYSGRCNTTGLGYALWKIGEQDSARKKFNESLRLDQKELEQNSEWYIIPYDLAAIHAIQGNKTEAYTWLQKAIEAGWRTYRLALIDPLFENLRNEQQFKQMMEEVKAKVDEMRRRVEQMEKG